MKNSAPIILKFVTYGCDGYRNANGQLKGGELKARISVDGKQFVQLSQFDSIQKLGQQIGFENIAPAIWAYRTKHKVYGGTKSERVVFQAWKGVDDTLGRFLNNVCLSVVMVASSVARLFAENKRTIGVARAEHVWPQEIQTEQQRIDDAKRFVTQRRKAGRLAKHQEFMAALNEVKAAREAREAEVRQNRSRGAKTGWAKRNEKRMEAACAIGAGRLQQWSAVAAYVL